ncbi:MAG: VOC family protein [Actinomycetota bacterium]
MDLEVATVVFDCADPGSLSEFWETITGYEVADEDEEWVLLTDPDDDTRIQLGFQRVPEGKSAKNRLHLDLYAADVEDAAEWLRSLGAKQLWVSDDPEDVFITLADPEDNEFCVVEAGADEDDEDELDDDEDDDLEVLDDDEDEIELEDED